MRFCWVFLPHDEQTIIKLKLKCFCCRCRAEKWRCKNRPEEEESVANEVLINGVAFVNVKMWQNVSMFHFNLNSVT